MAGMVSMEYQAEAAKLDRGNVPDIGRNGHGPLTINSRNVSMPFDRSIQREY